MHKASRQFLLLVAIVASFSPRLGVAQTNISSVNLQTTTGSPSVTDGLTYDNTLEAVTDFSDAAGAGYTVISSAPNAYVQRSGTPNQSSVWYAISSTTTNLAGVNQTDYGTLLRSNNLLEGADNVFANSNPGKPVSTGNIERLDYTWNVPFNNLNQLAFAVFERGAAGAHDSFTIAIVTGVDANGVPTSYGGFLKVAANWGTATNLQGNPTNQLLRYANGDNLTTLTNGSTLNADQNTQGVGGIVIKVSDVTLAAGSQVYGYSLMGADVNPTTASDLLNVANTSVYPATTADANGGIDLAAVNGLEVRDVPEPAIWALLGVGGTLANTLYFRRRLKRRRSA